MADTDILYIVVPCYNEQEVLPETIKRLGAKMRGLIEGRRIAGESRVLFVDDGSKDSTWQIIQDTHTEDAMFCGVKLSRNRGHQSALIAGLMTAKDEADMVISMDADLQDDVETVDKFIDEYETGHDIVYGVRSSRATDTAFKRGTAGSFYKVMQLLGVEIVPNHAEYRLMSKRALEGLAEYKEINLFLRSIVPQIGYPSAIVTYERHERFAGETKYPLKKMIGLAVDGITSFSVRPLRMITALGIIVFGLSILALLYTLIVKLCGYTVEGWAAVMCSIWMLGGIQLLSVGILGEYIGKIYGEVKHRPRYFIEKYLK